MKFLILSISSLFIFFNTEIYCQVSISPEIGMNYRPYILVGGNSEFHHNKPEMQASIMGEVFFSSHISIQSRIGYVFRKNTTTVDHGANRLYLGATFINRELTVNIDMVYHFLKYFQLGAGAGMIHKLNSQIVEDYTLDKDYYNIGSKIFGCLNFMLAFHYEKFGLNLRYYYLPKTELNNTIPEIINGHHGLSCGVSYRVYTSKKK